MSSSARSCIFFISLVSAISVPALSGPWEEIDKKVFKAELCEAYPDGEILTFQRRSCSRIGCDTWLYEVRTYCEVREDGSSIATIDHVSKDRIYSRETLTESRWRKVNGNLLRMLAANAESFGKPFNLLSVEDLPESKMRIRFSVGPLDKPLERGQWILGEGSNIGQVIERSQVRHTLVTEENTDTRMK